MAMMLMLARCVVDESIANTTNTNTVHEANFVHSPPVHRCKIQHNKKTNKNNKTKTSLRREHEPKQHMSDAKFYKLVAAYHKSKNINVRK